MMVVETGMTTAACNMAKRSETMMKNNFEAHHEWKHGVRKSSTMTMANVAHHEWKRGVQVIEGSKTCGNGISA